MSKRGHVSRAGTLVAFLLAGSAAAQTDRTGLVGVASVIDGDTLEIRGQRIRLHGIDAPESDQICERRGTKYRCGQTAALALADRIGRSPVSCQKRDVDRYRRVIAICYLGREDLNAWLVENGHAVAYTRYSRDYANLEASAKQAGKGIWAGSFQTPEDYRRAKRGGG